MGGEDVLTKARRAILLALAEAPDGCGRELDLYPPLRDSLKLLKTGFDLVLHRLGESRYVRRTGALVTLTRRGYKVARRIRKEMDRG